MNVVQKYGGTCLDTLEKVKAVAQYIASIKKEDDNMVVVASAMGSSTKELVDMAKKMGKTIPKRELEALLSTGEQRTVALLAIALQNLGVDAVSMTDFQSGFVDTEHTVAANVKEINTESTEKFLSEGKIVVMAGFQGIGENYTVDALGRGGSDTTAVAIAAQFDWPCEIYTDTVDAMYTADPKVYSKARKLDAITYEEMMELSSLGNEILETRSIELAKKYSVDLFIGKALETDKRKGTKIMNETILVEDMPITGITMSDNCTIYSMRNMENDGVAVADLFCLLAESNINVDMISKQIDGNGKCTVSFSCTEEQAKDLDAAIASNQKLGRIEIGKQRNLSILSLVGVGMATCAGVASKVFSILAKEGIPYYQITTSEITISVTVDQDKKMKAVIALCESFGL
ncbi:MAG: aspartate kinase [Anaerovorax sp.]